MTLTQIYHALYLALEVSNWTEASDLGLVNLGVHKTEHLTFSFNVVQSCVSSLPSCTFMVISMQTSCSYIFSLLYSYTTIYIAWQTILRIPKKSKPWSRPYTLKNTEVDEINYSEYQKQELIKPMLINCSSLSKIGWTIRMDQWFPTSNYFVKRRIQITMSILFFTNI